MSALPLSGHKCEFVREFANGGASSHISVVGYNDLGVSRMATFDTYGNLSANTLVSGNLSATSSNLTNYNYYLDKTTGNSLKFKIRLENLKNKSDIFTNTIEYDYSNVSEGYVSLSYVFNSVEGRISFLINGIAQQTVRFDPAKYSINDIFSDDITIGGTGFYNGQTLGSFLKQPTNYTAFNTTIKQIYLLNKPLFPSEITALTMIDKDVNDLSISIPSGQRSNIEEIVRFF